MNTSYFAKSAKNENAVSIAGKAPDWYTGRQYKTLAPKYWFFAKYKKDGDEKFYIEQYQKEVLETLDAKQVYEELGENAVLLCWEKTGKFCHRHLISNWFKEKLGIEVAEL
jgi:uncharacterized protein (DUF488 family)